MTLKRSSLALPALLAVARLAAGADAAGPQQLVQSETIALDSLTDQTRGAMYWSHGAFLFHSVGSGLPPTFYTLDREGRFVSSATLDIPGSAYGWTSAYDRQDDGSILVAGGTYSAYAESLPFIAQIAADGKTQWIIRTAPYFPHMLSIAPDGTFWTLGEESATQNSSAWELAPAAEALKHFDRNGKLLSSALPQSQFIKDYRAEHRLTSGFTVAARNRIGWYGPRSGSGSQYTEIDLDSMMMHSYPGLPDLRQFSLVLCFSLTEAGNAFVSVYDNASERSTTYMLDRAALKWLPLQGRPASERPGWYLIGVDGEQLVFRDWQSNAMFFTLSH